MSRVPYVPVRLCMGCGARGPQPELLRVSSAADGRLVLVRVRAHTGRTGYLHRQPSCWERFAARQGPVRSLHRNIAKAARGALVQQLKRSVQSAI